MELYKPFVVQFDTTKLNLPMSNDSVKKRKKIASDYGEAPKYLESSSDKKK